MRADHGPGIPAEAREFLLEPLSSTWHPPRDVSAVVVGDRVLVFRGILRYGPQCVAVAGKRGRRCKGYVHSFRDDDTKVYLPAIEHRFYATEPENPDAYLRQRCEYCIDSDVPDAVAPEWTLFDPAADGDLLMPLTPVWTPGGLVCRRRNAESGALELIDAGPTIDEMIAQLPEMPTAPDLETALYRWWDADGLLLYIGISDDLATRTSNHVKASSWMDFAALCKITRFTTRNEAAAAETEAIKAERPLFNDRHNRSPEAQRRLVEYLVKHGRADLLMPAVSRG